MSTDGNGPGRESAGAVEDEQAGGRVVGAKGTPHPYIVAVELLAETAERERVIFERAWSTGYAAGFDAGAEVGYDAAEAEMAQAWAPVAEGVRRLGRSLTRDELERRRWGGRREDFGKPRPGDHPGGPVDWHTGRPTGRRASA